MQLIARCSIINSVGFVLHFTEPVLCRLTAVDWLLIDTLCLFHVVWVCWSAFRVVPGQSEGMDGFTVTFTEAVCLGTSFALSGIFYYLHKKSRTTVDKLDVSCVFFLFVLHTYANSVAFGPLISLKCLDANAYRVCWAQLTQVTASTWSYFQKPEKVNSAEMLKENLKLGKLKGFILRGTKTVLSCATGYESLVERLKSCSVVCECANLEFYVCAVLFAAYFDDLCVLLSECSTLHHRWKTQRHFESYSRSVSAICRHWRWSGRHCFDTYKSWRHAFLLSIPPCLSFSDTACACTYVVGTVTPVGEHLSSQFNKEISGVLQKFTLKEHRLVWSSISRTWWEHSEKNTQ